MSVCVCVCVGEQGLAQPMPVREGPSWVWRELTCSLTQAWPLVGPGHPHSRRVHWGEASLDSGLRLSPPFSPKLGSTHSACPGTGKFGLAHAELHRAGAREPGLGLAGAGVPGDSGPDFLPSPCLAPVLGPLGL